MVKKVQPINVIAVSEELIKSYNPTTHSIVTHILEKVGDTTKPDAKPENVLIQQLVYGCFKEKPLLKTFIDDFYRDNASRVLRKDITMYTVVAYAAIFRIDELGIQRFRELLSTQEPSKMSVFINYLFNEENLWNTLRSSWMTVKDLAFVEQQMIPRLVPFISGMTRFSSDLVQDALDNAAAEQAKKDAAAKGEVGLAKVARRPPTVPISPRLTAPRPPLLPSPQRIPSHLPAQDVPDTLYRTSLAQVEASGQARRAALLAATRDKYSASATFRFHTTRGLRPLEEVRHEVEQARDRELQFNKSFYHPVPHPTSSPSAQSATVRMTAAAVLREDALLRKQQAADADTLRRYEEELRDATEYIRWQTDQRTRDQRDKLHTVCLRRAQAKESATQAVHARSRQVEDNAAVAAVIRRQGEAIAEHHRLEVQLDVCQRAQRAQRVAVQRETRPAAAVHAVAAARQAEAAAVREEMQTLRQEKDEAARQAAEQQTDRIRALRAVHSVHRPVVKVFDPTETRGPALLDSMSYLEMKERAREARRREEGAEHARREEIAHHRDTHTQDLATRTQAILQARQRKAEANQQRRAAEKDRREHAEAERRAAVDAAHAVWQEEVARRQQRSAEEKEALRAEQDRILRQQQYLGAAQGQVAEMRERQVALARDRQQRDAARVCEETQRLGQETRLKESTNKRVLQRQVRRAREIAEEEREAGLRFEKDARTEKLKEDVLYRKHMFAVGQEQHGATRNTLHETNPYATQITQRVHTEALAHSKRLASTSR